MFMWRGCYRRGSAFGCRGAGLGLFASREGGAVPCSPPGFLLPATGFFLRDSPPGLACCSAGSLRGTAPGLGPAAEWLSFAGPNESHQSKGPGTPAHLACSLRLQADFRVRPMGNATEDPRGWWASWAATGCALAAAPVARLLPPAACSDWTALGGHDLGTPPRRGPTGSRRNELERLNVSEETDKVVR
jgi:hypothetical protein